MMRVATLAGWVVGMAGWIAPPAVGQQPPPCTVELDSAGVFRQVSVGSRTRQVASGGVWAHCRGQNTAMYADSVAWYPGAERMDMVGQVRFRDSTVALDADRSTYFLADERLESYGSVRLINRTTGSVLTGPNLTYWRELPGRRDTTELYATNRPTVEYRAAADTAGAEPYLIVGDRVRLRGDADARAGGSVTIDRSDLHAEGDSVALDLDLGRGALIGRAQVESGDAASYGLSGRNIAFTLVDGGLNWIQARDSAEAISADWNIVADTLELDVVAGRIQGGRAWGAATRPEAVSVTYTMVADSLALDSPEQQLEEIRGYGAARAVSSPLVEQREPDWIAGDTVIARFDTTATGERVLDALRASGHAQAFYRVFDPDRADRVPDINYSRGDRIVAAFEANTVRQVDVFGEADGVHLEAAREVPPP